MVFCKKGKADIGGRKGWCPQQAIYKDLVDEREGAGLAVFCGWQETQGGFREIAGGSGNRGPATGVMG